VNNLLDLARIDADRMPMAYVNANLVALVREIAAGFEAIAGGPPHHPAAARRGRAVCRRGPGQVRAGAGQPAVQRLQVHPPAGASLHLERLPGGRVLVSVQDNGPGVPDAMKQQIFDRFTQGRGRPGRGGSGLGLNIVKEFVELHGAPWWWWMRRAAARCSRWSCRCGRRRRAFVREGGARAALPAGRRRAPELPALPAPFQPGKPRCWWPRTTPTCACFSTTC
jgi:signal transduction histidine kinase